ncbi:hypothetical protein Barb7_01281 [Bacteroidales bacterium Barb7]|nr:hypothetical protein Barb7_01281 [Bacteroidales bacterium Barb7]
MFIEPPRQFKTDVLPFQFIAMRTGHNAEAFSASLSLDNIFPDFELLTYWKFFRNNRFYH